MSVATVRPHVTIDEYLRLERAAQERHVYLDGDLFAMAGKSYAHGIITANLLGSLVPQLRGTPCGALSKDTKVRSGPSERSGKKYTGLFSYPDFVVVCGEPEFHDEHKDVILNPRVIIETLSPSTEAFDRGEKFTRYQRWNSTLNDYFLVSQDKPRVEHFIRQADGGWTYYLYEGLKAEAPITSIGCTLKLADVYDRVAFPPSDEASVEA